VNISAGFSSDAIFSTMISFVSKQPDVNMLRPLMIHLMICQMDGTLAITMYLHTTLTNPHFANHTLQSYGFLDPFNKGNVFRLSCQQERALMLSASNEEFMTTPLNNLLYILRVIVNQINSDYFSCLS
jgi:hypothetical protein